MGMMASNPACALCIVPCSNMEMPDLLWCAPVHTVTRRVQRTAYMPRGTHADAEPFFGPTLQARLCPRECLYGVGPLQALARTATDVIVVRQESLIALMCGQVYVRLHAPDRESLRRHHWLA